MGKLLILLAIALVAFLVLKCLYRKRRNSGVRQPPAPERMVACAHCSVHLPLSEALESTGRTFCSEEHRRLFDASKNQA